MTDAYRPEVPPPYLGEGPHALWHFSEDPAISSFAPRPKASGLPPEALVWAVDTRHAPHFWFPRDCPRACVWAESRTTVADRERFFGPAGGNRVHVVEAAWADAMAACTLYAYRMPGAAFELMPGSPGYWVSDQTVEPLERLHVGDVIERHAHAGIEVRHTPDIWAFWHREIEETTLGHTGSRLRNSSGV